MEGDAAALALDERDRAVDNPPLSATEAEAEAAFDAVGIGLVANVAGGAVIAGRLRSLPRMRVLEGVAGLDWGARATSGRVGWWGST